jgi:hypothetical protein
MLSPTRSLVLSTLVLSAPVAAQNPNPTNLWVTELRWVSGKLIVGTPIKLTADNGTNSQPSFAPDGKSIVFSAQRDTGTSARSDIYRTDLLTHTERRVTNTPENENSPTVNERGEYVAVRWQPATLFREFGPWVYSADGAPARGVLRAPDTTGYYTPLPNGDYALTRPKSVTFTLGIFDSRTGAITDVDSGLPALPAQRIPGDQALSYVRIDSANARHVIRRFDLRTRKTTSIGPTLVGRTAHAWIPGRRTILMAKGNTLYARTQAETTWRVVATFEHPELRNTSAYVVSPQGDKLILTSPKRLGFATILRDSIEAGHSGVQVGSMIIAMRDAGGLADVDVSENPINALARDRMDKRRFTDAAGLYHLASTLFPRSWRALDGLGDAQRASGENAAALASWRRALDLNPRSTDAERTAATAIERKISG